MRRREGKEGRSSRSTKSKTPASSPSTRASSDSRVSRNFRASMYTPAWTDSRHASSFIITVPTNWKRRRRRRDPPASPLPSLPLLPLAFSSLPSYPLCFLVYGLFLPPFSEVYYVPVSRPKTISQPQLVRSPKSCELNALGRYQQPSATLRSFNATYTRRLSPRGGRVRASTSQEGGGSSTATQNHHLDPFKNSARFFPLCRRTSHSLHLFFHPPLLFRLRGVSPRSSVASRESSPSLAARASLSSSSFDRSSSSSTPSLSRSFIRLDSSNSRRSSFEASNTRLLRTRRSRSRTRSRWWKRAGREDAVLEGGIRGRS